MTNETRNYIDETQRTIVKEDGMLCGRVVFARKNSGLFCIRESETGERFFGYRHETDAKIKEGKGVVFEAGGYDTFPDGTKAPHRKAVKVRNNPRPAELENDELRKAVTEYYEWQGDRRIHLFGVAVNRKSGYRMLLVHFTDSQGVKMSALMEYQGWAEGHWDVTEAEWTAREDEERMVREFVESQEYV